MLEPFEIKKYFTDGWGVYQRHLTAELYEVDQRQTQRIAREHLSLKNRIKRLARPTIYSSKTEVMHHLVIGPFTNGDEFK